VKAKTEELLYLLLWSCEQLTRPTFRNLTDSFEGWAYRNGFQRHLAELERRKLIESREGTADERVHRLTTEGRLLALGGRDPEERWSRAWDGQWRLVVFDLPLGQDKQRRKLLRYLHARHFGYLQKSVWITPDPMQEEREVLAGTEARPGSLILFEARPSAGESNEAIAVAAWDFPQINRGYERYMEVANSQPAGDVVGQSGAKALRRWASEERAAWEEAVSKDPLLPERLLPEDYLGKKAWRSRAAALEKASEQLRSFHGEE
jgi:phenylacetic acid degradation operon negative regulatory protein